jgi:hypothetical protein
MDRGANGGLAGSDVKVINYTGRHVDVRGIDEHQIVDIPIVTAGAVMDSQRGPVIGIMHQYAYTKKGKTIHSCCQLEWFKNDVNDRSVKLPVGLQRILTIDGYVYQRRGRFALHLDATLYGRRMGYFASGYSNERCGTESYCSRP